MSAPGTGRVVIPDSAQPSLAVVLTCGSHACRHTFEPDPVVFASGSLACPSCGGWTFGAALAEPTRAGGPR